MIIKDIDFKNTRIIERGFRDFQFEEINLDRLNNILNDSYTSGMYCISSEQNLRDILYRIGYDNIGIVINNHYLKLYLDNISNVELFFLHKRLRNILPAMVSLTINNVRVSSL